MGASILALAKSIYYRCVWCNIAVYSVAQLCMVQCSILVVYSVVQLCIVQYSCVQQSTDVYLTIILRARVEMVVSQRGAWRRVGYNRLISNKRERNNCFIKSAPKIRQIFPNLFCKKKPDIQIISGLTHFMTCHMSIKNCQILRALF